MWICLNRAFLSIVQPGLLDATQHPGCLQVRARRPGDIEKVFPDAVVVKRGNRDYLFRAFIPQVDVGVALMNEVMTIDYNNFKGSATDQPLHDAYMRMWDVHAKLQPTPPYRGDERRPDLFSAHASQSRAGRHMRAPQYGASLDQNRTTIDGKVF